MKSGEPTLRLEAVRRRRGVEFELGPIDLELAAGEWLALEGRSGSGKTTLLQLASGLDRADSGRVELFGHDLGRLSGGAAARLRASRVGIVHQEALFIEHLRVWENVTARFVPLGMGARERRERAHAALAAVDLSQALERRPRALSGGERQRVAVARALAAEPRLLLADEPTSNVDAETGARVLEAFRDCHAGGTAILLSSHDAAALAAAERRVRIANGMLEP